LFPVIIRPAPEGEIMKVFVTAVLASSIILTSACSESTSPLELPFGIITAAVGGTPFASELDSEYSKANNSLVFSATLNQGVGIFKKITISMQNVTGIGLRSLGETAADNVTYTESIAGVTRTWTSSGAGASGNLRIVSLNSNDATGQFAGTLVPVASTSATGNKVIADGAFEIVF
jgi:hypothetical protein